jgi:hypothetical protein
MEKTVLNLSSMVLTEDQMSVLSKGLNFSPTPQDPDEGQYKIDLESYTGDSALGHDFMTLMTSLIALNF